MENRVVRGVFEGVCKIALFIGYVSVVSLMKDIRRVFMYHGAEHKTIFCYEKGLPLTVENVRMQGRFHPRCGTSFMILMLLIGIIVAIFIPGQNAILRTFFKLLTLPVVVGIGYELIKLCLLYTSIGHLDPAVIFCDPQQAPAKAIFRRSLLFSMDFL